MVVVDGMDDELKSLVADFKNARAKLVQWSIETYPEGSVVYIEAPQFMGYAIVQRNNDCPADRISVVLENGNEWWHPILMANIGTSRPSEWPNWIKGIQYERIKAIREANKQDEKGKWHGLAIKCTHTNGIDRLECTQARSNPAEPKTKEGVFCICNTGSSAVCPIHGKLIHDYQQLRAQNEVMREALDKLARLGNGSEFGNSTGNCIAQAALKPSCGSSLLKELEDLRFDNEGMTRVDEARINQLKKTEQERDTLKARLAECEGALLTNAYKFGVCVECGLEHGHKPECLIGKAIRSPSITPTCR